MVGLDQLSNTIKSVKKHSNTGLDISGILFVKFSPRTNLSSTVLNGIEKMAISLNTKVFDSKIRETVKIKEAQLQRIPILDWDESCSAVTDYKQFACEFW